MRQKLEHRKKLKEQLKLAAELEQRLKLDTASIELREKLIICYFNAAIYVSLEDINKSDVARKHAEHVLWYVEHAPDKQFAGGPHIFSHWWSSEDTEAIKNAWLRQVEQHAENAWVLHCAAGFMILRDRIMAEELAQKAHSLAPENPAISSRLAHLLELKNMHSVGESRIALAKQVLELREQVLSVVSDVEKVCELISAAQNAFEIAEYAKARKYADSLLELARNRHWDGGNAFHQAHITLGRIALKSGDIEEAKTQLLESTNPPIGDQIMPPHYDLQMSLVRELLEQKQKEVVLRYFDKCEKFWNSSFDKDMLNKWRKFVRKDSPISFSFISLTRGKRKREK